MDREYLTSGKKDTVSITNVYLAFERVRAPEIDKFFRL